MAQLGRKDEDFEPLPTDGMKVEETRDPDTVRLFLRDWRRRVILERAAGPVRFDHDEQPRAMMRA